MKLIILQALIILLSFFQLLSAKITIFDLSYTYSNETIFWPTTNPEDKFKIVEETRTPSYEANRFCTPEHGGTHIDAPRHFVPGNEGVHEIDLQKLVGKAFFVDISEEAKINRDLLITQKHIEDAEAKHGKKVDDHIVLLYTGWSQKYPNKLEYLGTTTTNASLLHFPGLHPDTATWLVNNRKIKCIGLDTPSIDNGPSSDFRSHVILFQANIPALENVNLKEYEQYKTKKDLMIYALPMNIKHGSGAPTRIIATYDDDNKCNTATTTKMFIVYLILMVCIARFMAN